MNLHLYVPPAIHHSRNFLNCLNIKEKGFCQKFTMNNETKEALTKKFKLLQERCIYVHNAIKNLSDVGPVPNNIEAEASNDVEASRTEIQNLYTSITTDSNLPTSQYLSEIQQFTDEVEKFIAFTEGSINYMDAEMERLNNIIETSQEARSRSRAEKKPITKKERLIERFHTIEKVLHGLMYSLYPNFADLVMDVLWRLMQEKFDARSSGYIKVTNENYRAMRFLRHIKMVSQNPYNKKEFKLV
ncbi:unnamed protein product [Parnassius apollo]|uniref:(apollo) hypothetical protein n=1 Tax=Parnassius apollo TaxID=110799 RepID=A0A8S3WVA2_PARAO|nr:unnamed protein product [Parnassius apollo]